MLPTWRGPFEGFESGSFAGLVGRLIFLAAILAPRRPMATSLIWSLAFTSLVTLIVIPAFYLIGNDLRKKTSRRKRRIKTLGASRGSAECQATRSKPPCMSPEALPSWRRSEGIVEVE